jgi:hypothetical protein
VGVSAGSTFVSGLACVIGAESTFVDIVIIIGAYTGTSIVLTSAADNFNQYILFPIIDLFVP